MWHGKMKSRPATQDDIKTLYGNVPVTMRAHVLDDGGEVTAILGYYLRGGTVVVFSEIRKPVPKMRIWREAKKFMSELKIPAICVAEGGSGPLLKRLGWVTEDEEVFTWHS